jgi:hypothetical protein
MKGDRAMHKEVLGLLILLVLAACSTESELPVLETSKGSDAEVREKQCAIAIDDTKFDFLLETQQAPDRLCFLEDAIVLVQLSAEVTCEKCVTRAKLFGDKAHLTLSLHPDAAAPLLNSDFISYLQSLGTVDDLILALDSKQRIGKIYSLADMGVEELFKRIFGSGPKIDEEKAEDILKRGLSLIQAETMRDELVFFSSDTMNGRLSSTPENEKAAEFIVENLKKVGIKSPPGGTYLQPFRVSKGPTRGQPTANIIGFIEGTDTQLKDEYIVIGAHMDHAGTLSRGYTCSRGPRSNAICNGADDNGSGSIALLNIAKALAESRSLLARSVVLIWFSGEELGLEGSRYYVDQRPLFPIDQTVYMINLDMVGYIHTNQNRLGALGGGTSTLASEYLQSVSDFDGKHKLVVTQKAGGGSDHVPFMAKGIPGVFFNTGVNNNPNYHRTSDTAEKINYDGMVYAAKITYQLTHHIANYKGFMLTHPSLRQSLVTEEEMQQGCHEMIYNPYIEELDFTNSN